MPTCEIILRGKAETVYPDGNIYPSTIGIFEQAELNAKYDSHTDHLIDVLPRLHNLVSEERNGNFECNLQQFNNLAFDVHMYFDYLSRNIIMSDADIWNEIVNRNVPKPVLPTPLAYVTDSLFSTLVQNVVVNYNLSNITIQRPTNENYNPTVYDRTTMMIAFVELGTFQTKTYTQRIIGTVWNRNNKINSANVVVRESDVYGVIRPNSVPYYSDLNGKIVMYAQPGRHYTAINTVTGKKCTSMYRDEMRKLIYFSLV